MGRDRLDEKQNYYLMLELDFNKPEKDAAVIEQALKKKQAEWSKNKNNPGKKAEAEKCLELIGAKSDYATVMKDNPDEQMAEAKAAQQISKKKLSEYVIAFKGVGKVNTEDIENFLNLPKNKKYCFTIDAFRAEMKAHGIEEVKKAASKVNPVFAKTKKQLEIVGCANLYDFLLYALNEPTNKLGKPDGSAWKLIEVQNLSPAEMKATSTKISNTYNAKASKDQKNNACKELAGYCQSLLADPAKRKEYDQYLEAEVPAEVEKQIDIFVEVTGVVTLEQSEDLIKLFAKYKPRVSTEAIIEALRADFVGRGIKNFVLPQSGDGKATFKRCLLCGAISDINSTHCTSCGKPFKIKCFKCGAEVDNGANNCPKCGIDLGAVVKIENECSNAEKLLDSFDFAAARACINRAKKIVENDSRVLKIESEINKYEAEFDVLISDIKKAVDAKKLLEAEQKYNSLKAKAPKFQDTVLYNKINSGITEAREWLKKAKAAVNQEDMLIDYCDRTLSLCADMDEARQLILKYPPVAASGLTVSQENNSNLISWKPSPSKGNVLYRLVKKEGAVSKNDTDGILLAETSACQFIDSNLKANVATYYSVFTVRAGITTMPVFNKDAVYSYLDVKNFSLIESSGVINLSWELGDGVTEVEIYRKKGQSIQNYGDGQKLTGLCANSFSDNNLENDTDYYYSIYSIYRTAQGTVHSKGKMIKGTPTLPPECVENVEVSHVGNDFEVTWSPVKKGTIELLTSNKAIGWQKGEVVSANDIRSQLKVLPLKLRESTRATFSMMSDGVLYVYPINFVNQVGVIPEPVRVSKAADFTNLVAPRIAGNTLYISFDWFVKAESALLLYKEGGYPTGPDDRTATRVSVTKARYNAGRSIVIHNVERVNYYFTLYACYGGDDYSPGIRTEFFNAEQGIIKYDVKIEKGLFGLGKSKIKLSVTGEHINKIPRMVLVMKNGILPLDITDGIQVATVEETNGSRASVSIENNNVTDRTKFQLFFEDEKNYNVMQIMRG